MSPQRFPILRPWSWGEDRYVPKYIRWDALNEEQALRNHNQSLARLAERGGLSPDEAVANIERRRWRPMSIEEALTAIAPYVITEESEP